MHSQARIPLKFLNFEVPSASVLLGRMRLPLRNKDSIDGSSMQTSVNRFINHCSAVYALARKLLKVLNFEVTSASVLLGRMRLLLSNDDSIDSIEKSLYQSLLDSAFSGAKTSEKF